MKRGRRIGRLEGFRRRYRLCREIPNVRGKAGCSHDTPRTTPGRGTRPLRGRTGPILRAIRGRWRREPARIEDGNKPSPEHHGGGPSRLSASRSRLRIGQNLAGCTRPWGAAPGMSIGSGRAIWPFFDGEARRATCSGLGAFAGGQASVACRASHRGAWWSHSAGRCAGNLYVGHIDCTRHRTLARLLRKTAGRGAPVREHAAFPDRGPN